MENVSRLPQFREKFENFKFKNSSWRPIAGVTYGLMVLRARTSIENTSIY